MTRLNYSSVEIGADLGRRFELALEKARNFSGVVPHFIDGASLAEGAVQEKADPCQSDRIGVRYHAGSPELVRRAVAAARAAAKGWRAQSHAQRAALLRRSKQVILDRQVELAGIVSAETGKIRVEALAEIVEVVDLVEYYAGEILDKDGYARELPPGADETRMDVLRPYGVFGVISPFNFPAALAVSMSAGALLTGNTVVAKPSDKTPRSTSEILLALGAALPPGVLNIVQGDADIGRVLVDSDVDGIAFTGSAEVGWGVVNRLQTGPRRRPVLAEMGGHNPAIVAASADLDTAVSGIVRSAFGLSGQKCSACRRAIVERPVAEAFKQKLKAAAEALEVADPSAALSALGPVIDDAIAGRIDKALVVARKDGAVMTGGRLDSLPGHYFAPIVVADLPQGHALTREELFAPFLVVTVVDSFDAALREANAGEYGLSAGVFTGDEEQKQQFLDEIEAGVVYVNRAAGATTGAWPGAQTFCGWKASGSSGKGGLGPWYLPGFMREQSHTIVESRP